MRMPEFQIGARVWVYSGPDRESDEGAKGIPFAGQGTIIGTVQPGAGPDGHSGGYMVRLDIDGHDMEDGREFIWAGPDRPHLYHESAYGGFYAENVMIPA